MTWRWPNKFLDTIAEQGITLPVPKVLVEIIPLHSSTQEKRILVKVMLSFKNRNFVRFEQKNINEMQRYSCKKLLVLTMVPLTQREVDIFKDNVSNINLTRV